MIYLPIKNSIYLLLHFRDNCHDEYCFLFLLLVDRILTPRQGLLTTVAKDDNLNASQILENCINQILMVVCLEENDDSPDCNKELWNFVVNSLRIAIEELRTENTFTLLTKIVEQERKKCRKYCDSVSNKLKYENKMLELNEQILRTEHSFQSEMQLKRYLIEEQTEELQNLKIRNESELEFEKRWLAVQLEESSLKCELEEMTVEKQKQNLLNDLQEEKKVHEELLWYYEKEQTKVRELIAYWKSRLVDIEQRKNEIEILWGKQKAQFGELDRYRTMYNKRKNEMLEYEADKERRKKEYEYEQYRHKMATRIQAWWRGVMVRRCLGPFKYLHKSKDLKKRKMSLKKNVKK